MTHYGLNPSFVYGRLPLLADAVRRARRFQVFRDDGTPTPESSPLGGDSLPLEDGRMHGLRLFDDMGGTMPELSLWEWSAKNLGFLIRVNPGEGATIFARSWRTKPLPTLRLNNVWQRWHVPSLEALAWLGGNKPPVALRTLDWQRANSRPDWSKPRVLPRDLLQGERMAVELQAEAALLLNASLWLTVPGRFELPVAEYEARLEEYLRAALHPNGKPLVVEYVNELWNEDFPISGWLRGQVGVPWERAAAIEIQTLKRVADRVLGAAEPLGKRSWYLFVGGQLGQPSVLRAILGHLSSLGVTPDMAGPAIYAGPLRAQRAEWEATGAVPTQAELRASCLAALEAEVKPRLWGHVSACRELGVPYPSCYEVGQDMHAGAHPWRRAALEAQREEWMGELYRSIRALLESAGIEVACWYSAASSQSPPGILNPFGLLEGCDVAAALPKARGARGEQP